MNNSSEKVERHYAALRHEDKDTEKTENDQSEAQILSVILYSKYQGQLQPPCNKTSGRSRSITDSGQNRWSYTLHDRKRR